MNAPWTGGGGVSARRESNSGNRKPGMIRPAGMGLHGDKITAHPWGRNREEAGPGFPPKTLGGAG